MKTALQKLRRVLNTKLGFFLLVVLLFCLKSYWAYQNEFNLGVKGAALATLTAQAVSAAWVLKFLFGNKSILKIRKKNLKEKQTL